MTDTVTAIEPVVKTVEVAYCRCGACWVLTGPNREATLMMTREHCAPKICQDCGESRENNTPYLICKPCAGKWSLARYEAMPLAPEDYDGPVVADEGFWYNVDEFLEQCTDNGIENPYNCEPQICEIVSYPTLDIADHLSGCIEVDHDGAIDFDWVIPVQAAFDEALAVANKAGTKWWQGTGMRPRIDLAEYAKHLAAEQPQEPSSITKPDGQEDSPNA